jgi:hypothetical protein
MEILTPHDPEARYSQKVTAAGRRDWIGYRDHQTKTCDEMSPNVIVQVVTRPAPQQDIDALDDIHRQLTRQGFQPIEHVVDGGYVTPDSIHQAAMTWNIPVLGPVREDPHAAQRPGFTKEDFHIDWDNRTLTCPNGITSPPWKRLSATDTPDCPSSSPQGMPGMRGPPEVHRQRRWQGRHILLLPEPQQKIQSKARKDRKTSSWQRRYAIRAGCEATVSETVHAHGLRHCRCRGLAKTHVQHVLTAAGTNIVRLSECFPPGTTPASPPRPPSHFRQLCGRLTA